MFYSQKAALRLSVGFLLFANCLFSIAGYSQLEVKVMSYNIRLDLKSDGENQWDKRKDRVVGLMNYHDADLIGGQEVLHQQLQYMMEHLDGYAYIGVGRDDGKEAGEYSCIFYKKDKYEVIRQSTFWLAPNPDSIGKGWDAALNRVCSYGLFRDKKTKQQFWFFNTHFDHIGKTARLESAKLITEKIKELNKQNYPVIVSGDFNSKPDEPPSQFMTSVLQNARTISKEVYGDADTWNAFKFHDKPNGCIDYIFVSHDKRIRVSKFATLTDSYETKYPSDHFPVIATIQLTTDPQGLQAQPFSNEIAAFKKKDSVSFPPKNAILLVGSSSFTNWKDVQGYFPFFDIINRGFGGSTLLDQIRYEKDVIFPYDPRQIIIYCGENDLASSDTITAAIVYERFQKLFADIRDHYPEVHVVYISMKPSPSRHHLLKKVEEANELIRAFLKKKKKTAYVDVYHPMLRPDGSPRGELFLEDQLHMNRTGYLLWQQLIEPHLFKK